MLEEVLLISTDSEKRNRSFREKYDIPFQLLTDRDHAIADTYGIPISRKHPAARRYPDGFIQPAVLGFAGEKEIYNFIQKPKMMNLWGAARRPTPAQVLAAVRPTLAAHAH